MSLPTVGIKMMISCRPNHPVHLPPKYFKSAKNKYYTRIENIGLIMLF